MRLPACGREWIFYRAPLRRATAAEQSFRYSCTACRRSACRDDAGDKPDPVSCSPACRASSRGSTYTRILNRPCPAVLIRRQSRLTLPPCSRRRAPARQEYGWYCVKIQSLRGFHDHQIHSGPIPLLSGCSRDKSSTPRHPRAARQYQNVQSSTGRYPPDSC